jgi:tight adherence protein B
MSIVIVSLLTAAASLCALLTGMIIYAGIKTRARRLDTRFESVVSTYTRTVADRPRKKAASAGLLTRLMVPVARIINYDPTQPFLYSLKWYVVVPLAFIPARLAIWLLVGLVGDVGIVALPIAWILVCRMIFGALEARYKNKLLIQFPDALSMIVRAVRVGIPVNIAIQTTADESPPETAREFMRAAEQLQLGKSVDDAVAEMAERARITEYKFFATALALQSQTGGGLTETLENLADVIRKRVAMRARGNALAGEAKTSAGILSVLPIITLGALLVMNPDYGGLLFNDPGGRQLLAVGVGLLVGGILVMRSMIKSSLS